MKNKILIATSVALLTACGATANKPQTTANVVTNKNTFAQKIAPESLPQLTPDMALSMEKIMSHPDWMGRAPRGAYWGDDSEQVFFYQKRQGSELVDLHETKLAGGNGQAVPLNQLHLDDNADRVLSADKKLIAWEFEGNIFVKNLQSGQVKQITYTSAAEKYPEFLNDGRLVYRAGNSFIAVNPETLEAREIANLKTQDKPKVKNKPKDYIAEEQLKLIKYVAKRKKDADERKAHRDQLKEINPSVAPKAFYLGKGMSIVLASLSPRGDKMIVATKKETPWRGETDIMPNYIGDDSRIKSEKVRRRVADAKPESHQLWLLDLKSGLQHELSYKTLPDYSKDVLASVKAENAKRKGEKYQENSLPRDIRLMSDWSWNQSAVVWQDNGDNVAVMLEAWDNKDRWIATVDFAGHKLVSQHQLHDDAWINYTFNEFGWLNNSANIYFLSEQSGYSHLYLKALNGKAKALTKGQFEVSSLSLTHDDQFMYFKANKKHPGIYEIYRLNMTSGKMSALTDLNGITDYKLSPDEAKLLLTHSTTTRPNELFWVDLRNGNQVAPITSTVSEEFKAYPWQAPTVVQIPSSHSEQNIFARVYYPQGYDASNPQKYRAVVFNHGAGYLQNAHLGFSGYFREYMFHNLLTQKGYVVLDMDYRASKGYGRDWRTAIYRRMGTPEVEDLRDGVNWLVDNANVDRKRIGTYGGSYGGFLTFMSMFNAPDLFAAGAALRPVSDWAHYNTPYTSNILNTPSVDPIAFERSSPIYFAEGLEKPLLINAPMVDDNVFFVDVVRLVQRFIELEKENFETAIYPVEPHGFRQPSSWLDEYRRIFKLFEENL